MVVITKVDTFFFCSVYNEITFTVLDTIRRVEHTEEYLVVEKKRQETLTSHVDTVDKEVASLRTGQETLTSHVDTVDKEVASLRTGQETLTSHVDTVDKEVASLRTGQETLTSQVATIDRELTYARSRHEDLSNKVKKDFLSMRNQLSNAGSIQISAEGKRVYLILPN